MFETDSDRSSSITSSNTSSRSQSRLQMRNNSPERFKEIQEKNTKQHEKQRQNLTECEKEIIKAKDRESKRLVRQNYQKSIEIYEKRIIDGPTYICVCCGGLFFRYYVVLFDKEERKIAFPKDFDKMCCVEKKDQDNKLWICRNCNLCFNKKKIPICCLNNGLRFREIDKRISELTELEAHLCSPMAAFIRIKALTYHEQQKGLKGNVVCVPIDQDQVLKSLPRSDNENEIVELSWMRQAHYDKAYLKDLVSPRKIYEALSFLTNMKNGVFEQEGITIDNDWMQDNNDSLNTLPSLSLTPNNTNTSRLNSQQSVRVNVQSTLDRIYNEELKFRNLRQINSSATTNQNEDESNESDDDDPDHFVQDMVAIDLNEEIKKVRIQPHCGADPISITNQPNGEQLTFLKIYGGYPAQKYDKPISDGARFKSEFRMFDDRCRKNPEKIFYSYQKKQQQALISAVNICLKKTVRQEKLNVEDVRDNELMESIMLDNEAQMVMKSIRNSPSYWKEAGKVVMAMTRQLRTPHWFVTTSPSETRCPELIKLLLKVNKKENEVETQYSDKEIFELPRSKLNALISSDPITVARYMDNRLKALRLFIHNPNGPFSDHPPTDYFARLDHQEKGCLHCHEEIWCEGAPRYDSSKFEKDHEKRANFDEQDIWKQMEQEQKENEILISYIDSHVTCHRPSDDIVRCDAFKEYEKDHTRYDKGWPISHQFHIHRVNCRVYEYDKENPTGKPYRNCKYHFPRPILNDTMILRPLQSDEFEPEEKAIHINTYRYIREKLEEVVSNKLKVKTLEEFLSRIKISKVQYIFALRASIKMTTVFLKRNHREIMVNNYNPKIYVRHRGNMDIQYVTNAYGVNAYVVGAYVVKKNFQIDMIKKTIKDLTKYPNMSIRQKLMKVASSYSNATQISAQECAFHLLSMPLKECSRDSIFVMTFPKKNVS